MATRPALPFRMIRRGLLAASRGASVVVDRVLRNDAEAGTPEAATRSRVKALPPGTPAKVTAGDRVVTVESGVTILEAARQHDLDLRYYCGGNCSCGTCRVDVLSGAENLSKPAANETFTLGMEAQRKGQRLACQARVLGDVHINIPPW